MISKDVKEFCCEDVSLIENYDKAIKDDSQIWHCHHRLEIVDDVITSRDELINSGLYYNRPANELIFLTVHEHMILHSNHRTDEMLYALGSANRGKKFSKERRLKLSVAQKNSMKKHEVMQSEEYREKCRQAKLGEKNPNYGKVYTDEEKLNLSLKLKGKSHPQSEETRKLLSKINKGKTISQETKDKISKSLKGRVQSKEERLHHAQGWTEEKRLELSERFKGKHKSEETRQKMSEAAKKRVLENVNYKAEMSQSVKNSEKYKQAMAKRKGERCWNNGIISVRCVECPEGFVPGRLSRK